MHHRKLYSLVSNQLPLCSLKKNVFLPPMEWFNCHHNLRKYIFTKVHNNKCQFNLSRDLFLPCSHFGLLKVETARQSTLIEAVSKAMRLRGGFMALCASDFNGLVSKVIESSK